MNKVPTITIYGIDHGFVLQRFLDRGYHPIVDTIHGGDFVWLSKNYAGPHRFYTTYDNGGICAFQTPEVEPYFSIAFNEGVIVNEEEWNAILTWLQRVLVEGATDDVQDVLEKPLRQTASDGTSNMVVEMKSNYEFCYEIKDGKCFYEVWKPNTDRPYTVVIDNFHEVGHEPFFSSLFVCESWGVATADFAFLKVLWEHLKMRNNWDLESLVKVHVEECRNGRPEPRVYRKSLETVIKMFTDIGSKRKGEFPENPKTLVIK